jgi:hypothetical protein
MLRFGQLNILVLEYVEHEKDVINKIQMPFIFLITSVSLFYRNTYIL